MRDSSLTSPSTVLAALVAVLAVACSEGIGPDVGRSGVVFGRITAESGAPVFDALVNVTAFSGNCGSNVFANTEARTDSSGDYVTSVISFRTGLRRCLEVEAVPPEGTGLRSKVIEVPSVSFTDPGIDSLEVSLSLDSATSS